MNTPDAVPVALDTWPRRKAYTFFSGLSDPFYSVTVTADVTALHTYTKRRGLSFYYALLRSGLAVHAVDQSHDRIPICHPKRPAGPARTP